MSQTIDDNKQPRRYTLTELRAEIPRHVSAHLDGLYPPTYKQELRMQERTAIISHFLNCLRQRDAE